MSKLSFYDGRLQVLKTDADTLSRYWCVSSMNMSFTYFEVPANTEFEAHKHISEQITYVLEGELYFESNDKIYCLQQGDTIVIPSNVEHRVWTSAAAAKAIDSWSPTNDRY
jgi:quercetin dioxygenase-like cupin family protein